MARPVFRPESYESEGFEFTEPSITVPDQSLTVKDILYRFTQGLPLDNYEVPLVYGGDDEQDEDNFDVHPANAFEPLIDVRLENATRLAELSAQLEEQSSTKRDEQDDAKGAATAVQQGGASEASAQSEDK